MDSAENVTSENRRLRRTMRDLIALSTLPAVWVGLGLHEIARSLADALLHTLSLDLIYIRLEGQRGAGQIEIIRAKHRLDDSQVKTVKAALSAILETEQTEPPASIPLFGEVCHRIAVTRFGVGGNGGVLIAGSQQADFPTEQDRLLLGVSANQTAIVMLRRRADEQVREQQEWLRVTLGSIGDAVIATDRDGRVTFLNSVAQELTGWTQDDAAGQKLEAVFRILNEQTRQTVENPVEKVLREGTVVGLANHTILIDKNGAERPIDDSAAPIRDAAGNILGVVLIFRDVTEQRRAELHRSVRLAATQSLSLAQDAAEGATGVLRAVCENLGWDVGAFWTVNDAGTALRCTKSWHRSDAPVDEFLKTSCSLTLEKGVGLPGRVWTTNEAAWIFNLAEDSNFPRLAAATNCGLRSAVACPIVVGNKTVGVIEFFSERSRSADCDLLEVLGTVAGNVGQFIERKNAEEDVRRSERELADFFDNAAVGLHWVGPDGTILRANRAELEMLGYSREEYVGRSITEFHADKEAICEILRRLKVGEKLNEYPARLRCKDGSIKDVRIDSSVLWIEGRFIHTRCFTRDITERKRAEEELRRRTQSLEILNRTGTALAAELDLEKLVQTVTDAGREVSGAQFGAFFYNVKNAKGESYMLYTLSGVPREAFSRFPMPRNTAVFDPTFKGEGVIRLADVLSDPRYGKSAPYHGMPKGHLPVRSYLAVPVMSRSGEVLGGLFYGHPEPGVFTEESEKIVTAIAAQAAVAIDNARLFREAQREISDRKQAEAALKQSEGNLAAELAATSRLHALSTRLLAAGNLNAALDDVLDNAIATCGADFGNIQVFNPETAALEIAVQRGFSQEFLEHFRAVRIEDGSACAQAMQNSERITIEDVLLDPGFAPHRRIAAAAGFRAVQSTPLKTHDGNILGMLSTHFRAPHRASERDQRLLDLYARHAADLIERFRFEQALKEADRRKDEFVATLAHELRNPLAPMRNAVEILKRQEIPPATARIAREMIDRQLRHMVRLIDDLLDVSRITCGKLELRKERLALSEILEQAVETARPHIEASGHTLTVAVTEQPVYLFGDSVRLAQVFSNLLNNACKYTEKRGHIELNACSDGTQVVVSIKDSGIGIQPEHLRGIFQLFSQIDSAISRSQGGLGIGLALAKGLVEMHGGTIAARSEGQGKGSEFIVRLPMLDANRAESCSKSDNSQPMSKGLRILVVDDNRDSAESLAMLLTIAGNEVQVAHDGADAIPAAERHRPSVILLDLGMPTINGYEVCRLIRQKPWGKDVHVIAITGWGSNDDRQKTKDAGFDAHLVKPVEANSLTRTIEQLRSFGSH